jgi:hypothetical protein
MTCCYRILPPAWLNERWTFWDCNSNNLKERKFIYCHIKVWILDSSEVTTLFHAITYRTSGSTWLFETIVRVLTACHSQYTWDRSTVYVFFYLTEQHSKIMLHTSQVLCMCTHCDSTNINTIIEFVPNCLCSMSAVMVSLAVLIRTFSCGILGGGERT